MAGCAGHARPLSYLEGFEVGERGDSGLGGAHSRLLDYARAVTCRGIPCLGQQSTPLSTTERVIFAPAGTSTSA